MKYLTMKNLFRGGVVVVILGTLMDLAYHAIKEPDEIFPIDMPWELANHLVIMGGLGLLILGGIIAALRD